MLRIMVFGLCTIALAASASAFGSINSLGQQSEHEKITRLGLAGFGLGSETMDEIAGKTRSAGAVGVPDVPGRGLINSTEAHCDGGDYFEVAGYPQSATEAAAALAACRRFVFRALRRALDAAGAIANENGEVNSEEIPSILPCIYDGTARRAKCNVLEQMGLALHAAQDFYSHSNWVDIVTGLPTVENPPGLGQSGAAPFMDPTMNVSSVPGLISGCFEGKPERVLCTYNNGHSRVRHKFLNKDTGRIVVATGVIGPASTERGLQNGNFERAVAAAIADTRNKWTWLEREILARYGAVHGKAIICGLRNDNESSCR